MKRNTFMNLFVVVLILQIIAVSTEYWGTRKLMSDLDANMGLWKMCGHVPANPKVCVDIPQGENQYFPKHALNAVRAFSILAILATMLAMYNHHTMNSMSLPCCPMFCAGLLAIVASMIWLAKLRKYHVDANLEIEFTPGVSYYCMLVSGFVMFYACYESGNKIIN